MPELLSSGNANGEPNLLTKLGGKFGLIPPILAGVLVVYFWGEILPFLVAAADNTLHLILVGAAIVALLAILFDKRIQTLFFYFYSSLIRLAATGQMHRDPIGNMKTYVEQMGERLRDLDSAIGSFRGLVNLLKENFKANTIKFNNANATAGAAQRAADSGNTDAQDIFRIQSNEAARRKQRLSDEAESITRLNQTVNILSRMRSACNAEILDTQNEIDGIIEREKERKALSKADRSIRGILKGDITANELFSGSKDYLQEKYSKTLGDFDQLMDITKGVLLKSDFDDAAAISEMNARLNEWSQRNGDMKLGNTNKKDLIAAPEGTTGVLMAMPRAPGREPVPVEQVASADEYGKYFEK